jgi:hypothetical protein
MFLELIGFGTKRGKDHDPSVIGFKGSGIKLAAVAAMRLGLDLTISSTDERGRYVLSFEHEDVEAAGHRSQRIVLAYRTLSKGAPDGTPEEIDRRPWNMTLDAFMDWDKPIGADDDHSFKVLREFVCNAKDEDERFALSFSDDIAFAPEGETFVFLRYTDEVKRILHDEPDRYFKFLSSRAPLHVVEGKGAIYPKSEPGVTRLFHLGVLVGCEKPIFTYSAYDYSLENKDLISEERTIKRSHEYERELGAMLASVTDVPTIAFLVERIFAHEARLEVSALEDVKRIADDAALAWRTAFNARFAAEKVCIPSDDVQADTDAEELYGFKVARGIPFSLRPFMKLLGYPSAKEVQPVLGVITRIRFEDLNETDRLAFMVAFRLCARYFPERAKLPIVFFRGDDRRRDAILGYAAGKDGSMNEIWIACATPTSLHADFSGLLTTLIHEGRHIETQAGDYDRNFVRAAEKDILALVLRAEGVSEPGDQQEIAPNFVPVDIAEVTSKKEG